MTVRVAVVTVRIAVLCPHVMSSECLTCGACCFSTLATYVRVTGDDHARLGEAAERVTFFEGNRCYMRMRDGRCSALRVQAGRFVCSVYSQRPQICRDLQRGSPACEAEIVRKQVVARRCLLEPDG